MMKKIINSLLALTILAAASSGAQADDRPRSIIGASENTIAEDVSLKLGAPAEALISNRITSISFSSDGKYTWIGTLSGLSRLDNQTGEFTSFTYENGLPVNEIYSVKAGKDYGVWVGTNEAIAYFDGEEWGIYDEGKGFEEHRALTIKKDESGNYWFGTNDGVWEYTNNDRWRFFKPTDGNIVLRDSNISALAVKDDLVWVGGSELYSFVPSQNLGTLGDWTRHEWDGGFSKVVTALAVDREGRVWVGTNRGVLVFDGGFWTEKYREQEGLVSDAVNSIIIDDAGNKWFGTDEGLSRLGFNGEWTTYTEDDGLIDDSIMTLAEAPDGDIWIGTLGGVSHFDGLVWKNYRSDGSSIYDPIALENARDNQERQAFVQDFAIRDLDGHWAKDYMIDLVRQGVISGFDDGTYRPDAKITRAELLKMVLGSSGQRVLRKNSYGFHYTDVANNAWYAPYVDKALETGVVEAEGTEFGPNEPATRAEAAVAIVNAFALRNGDGQVIDFYDIPSGSSEERAIEALTSNGIINGVTKEIEVVNDEFLVKDRYDLKLARDLGTVLAELGYLGYDQVNDYYTRALFNAVSDYQNKVVYGPWNWNFGYIADEKTREMLGNEQIRKTEVRVENIFYPEANITRGEIAKMLRETMQKR